MFERFTERARQVVVHSQESARELKHNYIGAEHVLVGLLREEEGIAARVLASLDLTEALVVADIERIVGVGITFIGGQIPMTPRTKKMFERALREALSLGHNYIGTEHLLLALVHEGEGVGNRILLEHDITSERIRDEVIGLLSGPHKEPEDHATYSVRVACGNCGYAGAQRIPKRTRVEARRCPKCDCQDLARTGL